MHKIQTTKNVWKYENIQLWESENIKLHKYGNI